MAVSVPRTRAVNGNADTIYDFIPAFVIILAPLVVSLVGGEGWVNRPAPERPTRRQRLRYLGVGIVLLALCAVLTSAFHLADGHGLAGSAVLLFLGFPGVLALFWALGGPDD